jgi:predicted nucleic acid-binding protein
VIVTDASVVVDALINDGPAGRACRAALASDPHWAAPEHVVTEAFSAIRGRYSGGHVSDARVRSAISALAEIALSTVETRLLLSRMWALRDRFGGYDAACVATAELYECPLVTADGRLGRAAEALCDVHLIAPG